MTKRDAKRRAYAIVAAYASADIDSGAESWAWDINGEPLADGDAEKIAAALEEVLNSIGAKGSRWAGETK